MPVLRPEITASDALVTKTSREAAAVLGLFLIFFFTCHGVYLVQTFC